MMNAIMHFWAPIYNNCAIGELFLLIGNMNIGAENQGAENQGA